MNLQQRRHFVFVESNTTGTGRIAVERLLRAGEAVTFLARRPEMYPFLADADGDLRVEEVETNDRDEVAARVDAISRALGVDVLLTFSEYYIAMVAELAAEFGFRYLDPGSLAAAATSTRRARRSPRPACRRRGSAWSPRSPRPSGSAGRRLIRAC
jgi:NAD(P)-dependent dehydrogenase (short-subunit alcohol dehydrogenase family)